MCLLYECDMMVVSKALSTLGLIIMVGRFVACGPLPGLPHPPKFKGSIWTYACSFEKPTILPERQNHFVSGKQF